MKGAACSANPGDGEREPASANDGSRSPHRSAATSRTVCRNKHRRPKAEERSEPRAARDYVPRAVRAAKPRAEVEQAGAFNFCGAEPLLLSAPL
jgi:hypothetical protein